MKHRPIYSKLLERIKEPRKFIQVLLGPRQVGKTTLALQIKEALQLASHYVSADIATLEDLTWLRAQWEIARRKALSGQECLLIIDEVQKIPQWSDLIKKLWDEDSKSRIQLKVILLGSSPWLMQKGLTESLAGRFEILPINHWGFMEMHDSFKWNVQQYIYYGGYPGPAHFVNKNEQDRWLNYINDSLIETTISRDILLMTQVNKPILLRRLFQMGCTYSSQILSYQKMLGQLQDAGNTTTLAHYLELLSGAGMLLGLNKFSSQKIRSKASSPKLQVYNTALMSALSGLTFAEAQADPAFWGRLVESSIGAHLINQIRGTPIELTYWRENNYEVDFILKKGKSLVAIEVKSSYKKEKLSGMEEFVKAFHPTRVLIIGDQGVSIEDFLKSQIEDWI